MDRPLLLIITAIIVVSVINLFGSFSGEIILDRPSVQKVGLLGENGIIVHHGTPVSDVNKALRSLSISKGRMNAQIPISEFEKQGIIVHNGKLQTPGQKSIGIIVHMPRGSDIAIIDENRVL